MADERYVPGLENVVASETSISYLDVEGEEIVLRGYDLIELAGCVAYIDVAGLLLGGSLPDPEHRAAIERGLQSEYGIPEAVYDMLGRLPKGAHRMDVLRTGISALASYDGELDDPSEEANGRKALRLLAKVPQLVANSHRLLQGQPILEPRGDLSYSGNFLYMLTGREPDALEERLFDQSLIAYSEHEMPNSTFAARVIASTMSDMYGAVAGAVASLKGNLHGGANEAVMEMLSEAETAEELEAIMLGKLARKERIMGFGHRVYMRKADPRALLMKEALSKLAAAKGRQDLYDICAAGEAVMKREKNLYPNLDYYAAPVYALLGIPVPLFTPVFLAARTAGLCAHVIEQHARNRLFRPRVRYTGPRGLQP
ncbi:citrate synthase [Paenibacillus sp. LHD-117]|uniref:citrate synthase n=1 Tax=Paenibacillus sp. LHD-117 TaxID=3071412 RepID=UPI0027DEF18B|nr:citrate synthase [Paenibacillus sp. LHD-117]MDQ6421560.1 citrate synthase [Paenibacillus sp. LHD-117]